MRRTTARLLAISVCLTGFGTILGLVSGNDLQGFPVVGVQAESSFVLPKQADYASLLIHNGSVILLLAAGFGAVTALLLVLTGIPLGLELLHNPHVYLILPHGLIEFPALWLAAAAGFYPPHDLLQYLRMEQETPFDEETLASMARLTILSFALFALAGIVEVTVTKRLAIAVLG